MQKGIQTRLIIHEILFSIKHHNKNYDNQLLKYFQINNPIEKDKKFINNVVLESMRFQFHANKIIKKFAKKKVNGHQYIILLSAITQLIHLDFAEYATVNSTVEICKIKKFRCSPKFINAILRKIVKNKNSLSKLSITIKDLPKWLFNEIIRLQKSKDSTFVQNLIKKPHLHCVFKEEITNDLHDIDIKKTTNQSLVFVGNNKIELLPGYINGMWWVQDYSAMLPIHLTNNIKNKKVLDMCASPGGKSFQLLSKGANVEMIEKNPKRVEILENNLNRLNYSANIRIKDSLNLSENIKYDIIIIDAPCSSIGTIRRNPDILFRNKKVEINQYVDIQKKLLDKATKLLSKKGIIIYMVCSFAETETTKQVSKFIKKHINFSIKKFEINKDSKGLIDENGMVNIIPSEFKNILIDGFFAVKFIKND